jgi:hypothetical protein
MSMLTYAGPARHLIAKKDVLFSGTAAFDSNGTAYRTSQPGQPQYVGKPSRDLEEAWGALIAGQC